MTDLERAKEALTTIDCTCALCRGEEVRTTQLRGVAPLLSWLEEGLSGWSVADRVVGAGAAWLYTLLHPAMVYAPVMSRRATAILTQYGVPYTCDESNRHGPLPHGGGHRQCRRPPAGTGGHPAKGAGAEGHVRPLIPPLPQPMQAPQAAPRPHGRGAAFPQCSSVLFPQGDPHAGKHLSFGKNPPSEAHSPMRKCPPQAEACGGHAFAVGAYPLM